MDSITLEMLNEAKDSFLKGNYKLAEPLLQQLILRVSRNPEIFQMLGTIYYEQGQFNKAIRTFQRALEIDPSYTDASVGLSIVLNDIGKYDDAKKVFLDAQEYLSKKAGQRDPFIDEKLASKHEELGDLYCQYKRYKEGLDQFLHFGQQAQAVLPAHRDDAGLAGQRRGAGPLDLGDRLGLLPGQRFIDHAANLRLVHSGEEVEHPRIGD